MISPSKIEDHDLIDQPYGTVKVVAYAAWVLGS